MLPTTMPGPPKPAVPTVPRLISLREAARRSGLPYHVLYRLVVAGRLAACKPTGGRWYVERVELDRLIDEELRQNAELRRD